MTHSFFAVMGGFAVDTGDGGESAYVAGSPRLHVTANGIAMLAELGTLPAVSVDLIRDKSKANRVAKLIVLMQAGWLVVECVARAASRLPLTLLELNTVAHVACTLVAYVLWWNKPLDVDQPVVLACGKGKRPLLAAMCMFSRQNLPGRREPIPPEIHDILHFVSLNEAAATASGEMSLPVTDLAGPLRIVRFRHRRGRMGVVSPSRDSQTINAAIDDRGAFHVATDGKDDERESPKTAITLHSGEVLLPFGFTPNIASASASSEPSRHMRSLSHVASLPDWEAATAGDQGYQHAPWPTVRMYVDLTTVTRWRLACQSLREHEAAWSRYRAVVSQASLCGGERHVVYKYRPELPGQLDFVAAAVPDWPGRHLIPSRHDRAGAAFFSLCVLLYGGVHATAWNDYFPSELERRLWHISAVYVAASGLLWLALKTTRIVLGWIRESYSKKQSDSPRSRPWLSYFVTPLGSVVVMVPIYVIAAASCVYVAARVYLVVEAFISLRDVPPGVYLTPEWTRYLVHL